MSDTPVPPPGESKPPPNVERSAPAPTPAPAPHSTSAPPQRPSGSPTRMDSGLPSAPPGAIDRVARLQTIAAVVLGLALIAIPLYLWRRPRSESLPVTSTSDAGPLPGDAGAAAATAPPPTPTALPVTLSEAKVMECHDTGSRRTRPEDCDHLAAVEKGLAVAIAGSGACLPTSAGGGTLVYVLDASFGRKRHPLELFVPRDGRALKNVHGGGANAAVSACTAAVKDGLEGVSLEGIPHAHARYKIAITATYPPLNGGAP